METEYKRRHTWAWLVTAAVIAALLVVSPVFAEGEVPQGEDTPAGEEAPAEEVSEPAPEEITDTVPAEAPEEEVEPQVEEEAPEEEPAAEELPAEEESPPEEAAATEDPTAPPEEDTPPEETEVVVLDEGGEALDMVTEEAAEVLVEGDPWWKVGTTTYKTMFPGGCPPAELGVTCWESIYPIEEALSQIETMGVLPSDRKLYVEAGLYNDLVDVAGFGGTSILSQMNGLIGAGSDVVDLGGYIWVEDNTGGFTIEGFNVDGFVYVINSSGTVNLNDLDVHNSTGSAGLKVTNHNGSINVSDVNVHDHLGHGAWLENETSSGSVKVLNSVFNFNGYDSTGHNGLKIETQKVVTLEGVTASWNAGTGISIEGFSALTMNYVVANDNEYWYSGEFADHGIYAYTPKKAHVTMNHVMAGFNGGHGIYVETMGNVKAKHIEAHHNTTRKGLITGSSPNVRDFLSDDVDYDEWMFIPGSTGVYEIDLETWGHYAFPPQLELLDASFTPIGSPADCYGDECRMVSMITPVSLTAGNTYYLRVSRYSGHMDNATSQYILRTDTGSNTTYIYGGSGMYYRDDAGTGTFKLDYGHFYQNGFDGLSVYNRNSITVNSIRSENNGQHGAALYNADPEIDCSGGPCEIVALNGKGNIKVTSPKATGWLTANNFSGNGYNGLDIRSKKSVTLENLDMFQNDSYGLFVDNCYFNENTGTCLGSGSVKIDATIPNWANWAGENTENGIRIESKGTVTINKTIADWNREAGIVVDGLGNIKLKEVQARDNGRVGAFLRSTRSPSARTVTITDCMFERNNGTGLLVEVGGTITVKGTNSFENYSPTDFQLEGFPISVFDQFYEDGPAETFMFYIDNAQTIDFVFESFELIGLEWDIWGPMGYHHHDTGTPTLAHSAAFGDAGWVLVEVYPDGPGQWGGYTLQINDPDFDNAIFPGSGAALFNNLGGTKGITFGSTKNNPYNRFDGNSNMGLYLKSDGAITLTNTGASWNYRSGLSASNPGSTKNLTIQDKTKYPESFFDGNGWSGVFGRTQGNIKVYGIGASENGESGLNLNNCLEDGGVCLGKGSISVMHKAYWHAHFDNNGYMGIEAISKGSQSYKNIHACNNGHTGMRAKNRWTGATAGITLSRSGDLYNHFDGNGWNAEWEPFQAGLRLSSHGNVSVSYVTAEGNVHGRGGINIFSASAPANRSATVKYGMFNDNEDYGMGISVGGNITVMDVEAMRNGAGGAILGNDGGSGNVYLKYSSKGTNNFSENNGPGLEINTTGKVTMGNLLVENNARTDSGFDDLMLGVPQSRHEMFNDFAGPDRYWFYVPPGEIGTYNFYLKGSDGFPGVDLDPFNYDAYLQLWKVGVESNPDLLVTEDDDSWGFPDATFAVDFSLGPALYGYGEPGLYYLEVSSSEYYWWEEGGSGFYQLGINDPTFSAMNYEWIGGANVNAGDSVTVSGKQRSEFNNNSLVGLNIWTPGNITVKWAQARGNGAEGFFLDNEMGSGKISFTGSSTSKINRANGNGWQGAVFYSTNTVTLKNALANWNGMEGYLVGTDTRPTGNAVYLTDVYAGGNALDGIEVHAVGMVKASKLFGENNGDHGVLLNNTYGPSYITLSGESIVRHNGMDGLRIVTPGKITVSKLTSEGNEWDGMVLISDNGDVSLSTIISRNNRGTGLAVLAHNGNVTLTNVVSMNNGADNNDAHGAWIDGVNLGTVTIKYSVFMTNEGSGIHLKTGVPYTIYKTYYFGNDRNGNGNPNIGFH